MGQAQSIADNVIPGAVDAVHMQVVRHAKVLTEINNLSYEEFKECLDNLNSLACKCINPDGKQLVFLVKRGTDTTMLWKATVKIACVKVNPTTRQIDNHKLLNLKQFLCVFKTFQSHLDSLVSSEHQIDSRRGSQTPLDEQMPNELPFNVAQNRQLTASVLLDKVNVLVGNGSALHSENSSGSGLSSPTSSVCAHAEHTDECSICLDRRTEVILPCTHSFCTPCIEQWNVNNKTCPICCEQLASTDEIWVLSDIPGVEEISEKICSEFMELGK